MYAGYYGVVKDHMMLLTQYLKNEFVSDGSTVYKEGQSVRGKVCHIYFVTEFVKTDPNHTRTEIHFIAEHLFYCWTLNLYSCTTQKHQTHGYRWPSLLSKIRWSFTIPVKPLRCSTVFGGQ